MVSHGVPRATKQLRLSFPSCKKRPISWLPDKCDDWVSDISLHVQKIPSFFIILSLNHSRKYFLNVSPHSMKLDDQGRFESQVKTYKCSFFKAQNNSHIPPYISFFYLLLLNPRKVRIERTSKKLAFLTPFILKKKNLRFRSNQGTHTHNPLPALQITSQLEAELGNSSNQDFNLFSMVIAWFCLPPWDHAPLEQHCLRTISATR